MTITIDELYLVFNVSKCTLHINIKFPTINIQYFLYNLYEIQINKVKFGFS